MKASPASAAASRGAEAPAVSTGKSGSKPVNAKPAVAKGSPGEQGVKPTIRVASAAMSKPPEAKRPDNAPADSEKAREVSVGPASGPVPPVRVVPELAGRPARQGFAESAQAEAPQPPVSVPAAPPVEQPGPARYPGPAPRPMAKAETFVEGDHVVYPTHGVGKVERIAIEDIAGHRLELIHITFEENRMTLRVPVAKARSAGLRKLASRKMFDEALGVLRGRARVKRTMWSRRAQEYEAKINSGDPLAIAEVVRDLHRNAGQPDQSFSERQIYEQAMDRLAAELAALDKTDKMAAATKLAEFLKTV